MKPNIRAAAFEAPSKIKAPSRKWCISGTDVPKSVKKRNWPIWHPGGPEYFWWRGFLNPLMFFRKKKKKNIFFHCFVKKKNLISHVRYF